MSQASQTERQIWSQFQRGDRAAFSHIYHTYYKDLYRYGYKITADSDLTRDYIQAFFLYLWERRESLRALDTIRYYLIKAFRRHVFRAMEKETRFGQDAGMTETAAIVFSPEEVLTDQETESERNGYITQLLNSLSPRQREIIYLRYYEEMSPGEIAEVLSINYQSVINHLHQALYRMKDRSHKVIWPLIGLFIPLMNLFL